VQVRLPGKVHAAHAADHYHERHGAQEVGDDDEKDV